jgi:hypothetical protein
MTAASPMTIAKGLLQASAGVEQNTLTVRFAGTADTAVTKEVGALLTRVHQEALATHATSVDVDFRDLEFMNSSCFKCFVTWLSRVRGLKPEMHYRIRFLSDPTKHWQRRSLAALSCFAIELVQIVTS